MTYPTVAERPQPPAGRAGWTAPRVISVVAGAVLLVLAVALAAGATVALVWWGTQREDGYLTAPARNLSSTGYAVTTDRISLGGTDDELGHLLGDVRLRVTAPPGSGAVFAGIAPASAADSYLAGVDRSTVHRLDHDGAPQYRQLPGGPPPGPPAAQRGWAAAVQTSGTAELRWHASAGHWTVVLMRADGGPGVQARVQAGATVPALPWIAGGVLAAGALLAVVAVLLLVVPLRRVSRQLGQGRTAW